MLSTLLYMVTLICAVFKMSIASRNPKIFMSGSNSSVNRVGTSSLLSASVSSETTAVLVAAVVVIVVVVVVSIAGGFWSSSSTDSVLLVLLLVLFLLLLLLLTPFSISSILVEFVAFKWSSSFSVLAVAVAVVDVAAAVPIVFSGVCSGIDSAVVDVDVDVVVAILYFLWMRSWNIIVAVDEAVIGFNIGSRSNRSTGRRETRKALTRASTVVHTTRITKTIAAAETYGIVGWIRW
mmetsp:Transcript_26948/g.58143  ORF Transcript_26948/g.58143 Transcript_26948/m.58143 type:complete len:236 (-) Transcript_26948:2138-2845(-)